MNFENPPKEEKNKSRINKKSILKKAASVAAGIAMSSPFVADAASVGMEKALDYLEKPNKNSEEFKMISEDRVRDFEKIISNISNEKKKIVMGALKNNMKVDLSNTDSGAPEILIIQQKIRDLQNSGEMSTDHPDLSENLPEMISDLDNRKKVDGKIDKEKIQDITLDTATTDQIINWANFIKKEKK